VVMNARQSVIREFIFLKLKYFIPNSCAEMTMRMWFASNVSLLPLPPQILRDSQSVIITRILRDGARRRLKWRQRISRMPGVE